MNESSGLVALFGYQQIASTEGIPTYRRGARRALSLFSTEMPASPPTNVIHVVMHDVRADIDTPALSALRSDGATYTYVEYKN